MAELRLIPSIYRILGLSGARFPPVASRVGTVVCPQNIQGSAMEFGLKYSSSGLTGICPAWGSVPSIERWSSEMLILQRV